MVDSYRNSQQSRSAECRKQRLDPTEKVDTFAKRWLEVGESDGVKE